MQPSLNKTTLYNVVNIILSLITQKQECQFGNWISIIIQNIFCYPFHGQEPTTWPAYNCVRIMVCWCIIQCNLKVFCYQQYNPLMCYCKLALLNFLMETSEWNKRLLIFATHFVSIWDFLGNDYNYHWTAYAAQLACFSLTSHGSE